MLAINPSQSGRSWSTADGEVEYNQRYIWWLLAEVLQKLLS